MELTIWCDESDKTGKFFSNFYGGVLVRSKDLRHVQKSLEKVCSEQNLHKELKWERVTEHYLTKYKAVMDAFFDHIEMDRVKVKIMFTHNAQVATNLTKEQRDSEYFLLYYQFVKHAFGLCYCVEAKTQLYVRVYFDHLPDTLAKRQNFKEFIKSLETQSLFKAAKIRFRKEDITEINSKEHLILQCLDVVLGAMTFRLNNKHLEKPPNARVRGKRTRAKEALYKHISTRIRKIYPGFNIGESTSVRNAPDNKWKHPYRHWKFTPAEFETDESFFKP